MKYHIEEIFKEFGQFDRIVTISFFTDSPSYSEYPDLLTGTFYYTPKERADLEERIHNTFKTVGFVKFKEVLKETSNEQNRNLRQAGINCEDISTIFFLSEFNNENKFQSTQTKKLPNPNIIEIDDNFDYESIFVNLYSRKIADGDRLTPEEEAEFFGLSLSFEGKDIESISDPELVNNDPGKLLTRIKKYYLKSRLTHNHASDDEINELKEIEFQEIKQKILVLRKEIERVGIRKENIDIIKCRIEHIVPELLQFREKRLTHGKFAVWLNYKRFLHIFLEHVSETNLGGNFESKTKFQYVKDDIFRLIEIVLDIVYDEIQKHFIEKPEKNFKRHGEMAIYYDGDYYALDINPSGLLMTFYKWDKNRD
ncbi:MAG: hypothetical protein M1292_06235 [Bacteroidetes bacterium]|nr:hypothetical protein [Bacteroidota bacterium]